MRPASLSWREACVLALEESDPKRLTSRIDCAINALQRRYAECASDPLTPAELSAIHKTILALERLMQEKLHEKSVPQSNTLENSSDFVGNALLKELGHAKHMLRVLRP